HPGSANAGAAQRQHHLDPDPHGVHLGHHLPGPGADGGGGWRRGAEFCLAHVVWDRGGHQFLGSHRRAHSSPAGSAPPSQGPCAIATERRGGTSQSGAVALISGQPHRGEALPVFLIDKLILLAAVLILMGILSSKISARLGLPMLVLFLVVGMLAGEAGIGGIAFDNAKAAHALGTLALALILFDGGLQTPVAAIREVWKPSALLATVGVLVTALVTGWAASHILDIPLLEGLLLGAIVGSTDAAAVFSLMRNAGIHIKARLKATLEIESASNDPMAIFLTVGLLEILVNGMEPGTGLLSLFAMQMGVGAVVGLGVGWVSVRLINRIQLVASGLYPVMVAACGLLAFGLAANLGGSGFLAIFLAGVVVGNNRFVFQRGTFLFHDGLAWLSQITMFAVLGLLVNPPALLDVWLEGLLISAVLVLVARPLAVVPILRLFGFDAREITLVSWVGLRGSVPIILAIFPLVFGLPGAALIFNVVFFVVLISATVQGSTLPWIARRLGLTENPPAAPAATLEITALGDVDADIVEYTLG